MNVSMNEWQNCEMKEQKDAQKYWINTDSRMDSVFFQNQFFKSFFTTAGLSTPRCDLNGLLIHEIYWKG